MAESQGVESKLDVSYSLLVSSCVFVCRMSASRGSCGTILNRTGQKR